MSCMLPPQAADGLVQPVWVELADQLAPSAARHQPVADSSYVLGCAVRSRPPTSALLRSVVAPVSSDTADRESFLTATEEWLDQIFRDDAGAEFAHGHDAGVAVPPTDRAAAPMSTPAEDRNAGGDEKPSHAVEPDGSVAESGDRAVDLDDGDIDVSAALETGADDPEQSALSPIGADPLAELPDTGAGVDDDTAAAAPRLHKTTAIGFAVATAVATLVVSGALLAMRSGPHTADADQHAHPSTQVSVVAAPTTSQPAADSTDSTIPYTATAVGCLPGSTSGQSVAGSDPTQAWVCVHGGTVGQYLLINLGRTMVITAVSITPGWVGADASGADQWQQHRVVTRVQWSFNDSPPTVVPQDTGSVHGEATKPMPGHGVLASRIIMLVQDTARAPADTAPTTSATPAPGGLLNDVLGPPAAPTQPAPTTSEAPPGTSPDQTRTDPADNTFAVSSIKIFGHPPQ
jgi:hypothetical protein